MISSALYRKHPESWWLGKKVRTRHDIHTSQLVAPAGTIFGIIRKHKGFGIIKAEPCACCGLRGKIVEVRPELLELITENGPLI